MIIPGTDGKKMSKSYNNYINILGPEKMLKKQIMSIVTDSKGLEDSKEPNSCHIFQLYKLMGSDEEVQDLKNNYINGGFGYGHAKNELFKLILSKYKNPRSKFDELMKNPQKIENELQKGSEKAKEVANSVLKKVKTNLGLM